MDYEINEKSSMNGRVVYVCIVLVRMTEEKRQIPRPRYRQEIIETNIK
jgi:hypothetical protein